MDVAVMHLAHSSPDAVYYLVCLILKCSRECTSNHWVEEWTSRQTDQKGAYQDSLASSCLYVRLKTAARPSSKPCYFAC